MSWQGNECFIETIEYGHENMEGRMLDAVDSLLWMYGNHGRGWYLLGYIDGGEDEEDCFPFKLYDKHWGYGWLPNPFMHPDVMAVHIRRPHDLLEAAFECHDSCYDFIAYAGDGDEPLESVTVYGKTYDMRPERSAA